ncbi:MAG: hypothetical protein M3548_15005, partial [Actinomycetota bacterium]|nr:hypothetical protein [Actinomycetota bacterium]
TYRVLIDGVWVGWVGDGRHWRGWGYGGRRWWSCRRHDGDTAARWNSHLGHTTRASALTALLAEISNPTQS